MSDNYLLDKILELQAQLDEYRKQEILGYSSGAWVPAAVGLTTPVYADQTGTYVKSGNLIICHFRLDITSWAAQSGYIRVTIPPLGTPVYYFDGSASYYRAAGSANQGPVNTIISGSNIYFGNATAGDSCNWEASSRVVLGGSISYTV